MTQTEENYRATHVPADWMPKAPMRGIVAHWTGGAYTANGLDILSYHLLIQGPKPSLVKGKFSILANVPLPQSGGRLVPGTYAAHCLNNNSYFIGVSICSMGGHDVSETPFRAGSFPMTKDQWDGMINVLAQLCIRYAISVTPQTVLSHAEVQKNLRIKQKNKWDYTRLAFDPSTEGATMIGDMMRRQVRLRIQAINGVSEIARTTLAPVQPRVAQPTTTTTPPAVEKRTLVAWWRDLFRKTT